MSLPTKSHSPPLPSVLVLSKISLKAIPYERSSHRHNTLGYSLWPIKLTIGITFRLPRCLCYPYNPLLYSISIPFHHCSFLTHRWRSFLVSRFNTTFTPFVPGRKREEDGERPRRVTVLGLSLVPCSLWSNHVMDF